MSNDPTTTHVTSVTRESLAAGVTYNLKTHKAKSVSLAAKLHDMWRTAFEAEHGVGTPRMKDDGTGGECNINAPFEGLPAKWQAENLEAASHAVAFTARVWFVLEHELKHVRRMPAVSYFEDLVVELVAEQVHIAWLERNAAWAPAELAVPYAELPDDEQEKDRVIARLAFAELNFN